MSDLIRREEAIDIVDELFVLDDCYCDRFSVIGALRGIPSAEPERKTGRWIYDTERVAGDGWTYRQYHCSECGFQELGGLANFCPNCGVEMTRGDR